MPQPGCTGFEGHSFSSSALLALLCRCDVSQRFNTIMAYQCDSGSSQLGYFSTPTLTFNGVPIGDAATGHCARALGERVAAVAGFRACKTDCSGSPPPSSPPATSPRPPSPLPPSPRPPSSPAPPSGELNLHAVGFHVNKTAGSFSVDAWSPQLLYICRPSAAACERYWQSNSAVCLHSSRHQYLKHTTC